VDVKNPVGGGRDSRVERRRRARRNPHRLHKASHSAKIRDRTRSGQLFSRRVHAPRHDALRSDIWFVQRRANCSGTSPDAL
jgi:hypothetical protein